MANETGMKLFVRATRAKVLPVMLTPVTVGAAVGWERSGVWSWPRFALTVAGAAAMHLAANVINDIYDEESGAEVRARADHRSVATGSGVLGAGLMSKRQLLGLAGALFSVALACAGVLAALGRPHVLWLGVIGFVLAWEYVGPPLRYGFVGRGLGEVGIFLAFGLLPVAGSAYVQAGRFDAAALWASVVPGLLAMLVLYHHHFLHWQSDRSVGKMTPVAALKPDIALVVGRIALIATTIALAIQTLALSLFPPAAFLAALSFAPVAFAQQGAAEDPGNEAYVRVLGASLGASVVTGAVLVLAAAVRVALR
ncbi:MAG TPA: prenyltransferase [Actinomycetota bacterium]|nr:prenyltransferase [Actinomycetota bacterium]